MNGHRLPIGHLAAIVLISQSIAVNSALAEPTEAAVLLISHEQKQLSWLTNSSRHEITLNEQPGAVSLNRDGTVAYIAVSRGVSVFDIRGQKRVTVIPLSTEPKALVLPADDRRLFALHARTSEAMNDSFVVSAIDTKTAKVVGEVHLHQLVAAGMAATPDGAYLYVTHDYYAGQVSVIDTHRQRVSTTIRLSGQCSDAAVSPDGRHVYVNQLLADHQSLAIIDTATHQLSRSAAIGAKQRGLTFQSDGQRLFVATFDDDSVVAIDGIQNEPKATIPLEPFPTQCIATPSGDRVYVRLNGTNRLAIVDTATKTIEFVNFDQPLIDIVGLPLEPTHDSATRRAAAYASLHIALRRCSITLASGFLVAIALGVLCGRWSTRQHRSFGWIVFVGLSVGTACAATACWMAGIPTEHRTLIYYADVPQYISFAAPTAFAGGVLLTTISAAAFRFRGIDGNSADSIARRNSRSNSDCTINAKK